MVVKAVLCVTMLPLSYTSHQHQKISWFDQQEVNKAV